MDWGPRITYLASTAFKERVVPFGIKDEDRQKHVCVLGKVGSGRGSLLSRMALQDIERGLGTLIIDASGNLSSMVMERLSKDELERLVYIDTADAEYPFSWNIANEFRHSERGAALFSEALTSLYSADHGPLSDFFAAFVLKNPDRTVLTPYLLLSDDKVRDTEMPPESDDAKQFAELRAAHTEAASAFLENGKFLMKDTMVRNVLGQKDGKFSLSTLSESSIFIVDLSRIRIFPTRAAPLVRIFSYAFRAQMSSTLTATMYLHDGLRYLRDQDAESLLSDQSYALTLSDTVYRESDLPLREKALSRCGSVVAFSPHQSDIPLVQRFFYPYVTPEEIQGLEPGEACVTLTIDASRSRPFFANALELSERKSVSLQDILVDARKKYTTPRTQVDELFKKQNDADKKKGQPPFNDAFKNIFAKRDPTKALAPGGDKKPDPERPSPEQGVQQSAPAPVVTQPAVQVRPVPVSQSEMQQVREVPETELKELMFVFPIPI